MTIKKSYKELNLFVNQISNTIGNQQTKVQKKLFKMYEKVKPYHEAYGKKVEELRLDNAATDEKGILLVDEKGGYKFNKEGIKQLSKQIDELGNTEFDFTVIEVINKAGLESLTFLKDWTSGIDFVEEEEGEEL